eukprot:5291276-Pyramimonas_sp.AAC.1
MSVLGSSKFGPHAIRSAAISAALPPYSSPGSSAGSFHHTIGISVLSAVSVSSLHRILPHDGSSSVSVVAVNDVDSSSRSAR